MDSNLVGAAGKIEVASETVAEPQAVAVISHPHPLYGGTMGNKVVTTAAKACKLAQVATVRHNFRGVGKTEGVHDKGEGELADTLEVVEYAKQQYPGLPLVIIGFSFGAAISIQVAQTHPQALLVAISPPIYPQVDVITEIANPWHLCMGEADEVVAVERVKAWLGHQKKPAQEHWFADTSHFFHGKLIELRQTLVEILQKSLH